MGRSKTWLIIIILTVIISSCSDKRINTCDQEIKRCNLLPTKSDANDKNKSFTDICGCKSLVTEKLEKTRSENSNDFITPKTIETPYEKKKALYKINNEILKKNYSKEWEYLGDNRPERGLALSGGGTRSASFSIGVMKALQENGILDKIDVISSVSGGSYASYWYFMQNYYLNRKGLGNPGDDELSSRFKEDKVKKLYEKSKNEFTEKGVGILFSDIENSQGNSINNLSCPDLYRFQYTLQNSSEITNYEKKNGFEANVKNTLNNFGNVSTYILSIPFHWLINGVFNGSCNLNPLRHYYQNGIERSYGYVPLAYSLRGFANDKCLLFDNKFLIKNFPRASAKDVNLYNMQKYLENYKEINKKKLPYFIINTSADYSSQKSRRSSVKDPCTSVYEYTPWSFGSGLTGYRQIENDKSNDISFGKAVSISGAAVSSLYEPIDIAGNSETTSTILYNVLNVFNFDLGYKIKNHDSNKSGLSHNIGWLIDKLPFVHYPKVLFTDNKKYDDIILSDGGHIDNLGVFSLIRRGVKKIIVVDAEQDADSTFSSLKRLNQNLKKQMGMCIRFDNKDVPTSVYHCTDKKAIFRLFVDGYVNEQGEEDPIELFYIKLSIDKNNLKEYPVTVADFASTNNWFPHNKTSDIFYDAPQFKAYRDLGYKIGLNVDLGIKKDAEESK